MASNEYLATGVYCFQYDNPKMYILGQEFPPLAQVLFVVMQDRPLPTTVYGKKKAFPITNSDKPLLMTDEIRNLRLVDTNCGMNRRCIWLLADVIE